MMREHPLPKDLVDPFAAGPILFPRDPTLAGSLHVVAAGSVRCAWCPGFNTSEGPYCSPDCAEKAAIWKAKIEGHPL